MGSAYAVTVAVLDTAPDGLSAEMAMLDAVAAGRAASSALLWTSRAPWLVLPERLTRSDSFEAAAADSGTTGWPVTARRTGGGITPQGPGVLNLALAFRVAPGKARTIRDSYDEICTPLVEAFAALGVDAAATPVNGSFCDGEYNLAVGGRKIVGTAQRWRGAACLAHALILTDIVLPPAVAAVQRLSDGLGHSDVFAPDVHCRLADVATVEGDVTDAAVRSIRKAVERRGYESWPCGA